MLSPIQPEHRRGNGQLTRAGQMHLIAQLRIGVEQMGLTPTEVATAIGIHSRVARAYAKANGIYKKRVMEHGDTYMQSRLKPRSNLPERAPADPEDLGEEHHRRALHDAEFHARQNKALKREIAQLEKILDEVSGAAASEVNPPAWLASDAVEPISSTIVGCFLSDIHMGEVIEPGEVMNLNAFNPDICDKRLQRYFHAACKRGKHWADGTNCRGALLVLGGDLISGDIHDELRETNAFTSHEQLSHVVGSLSVGLDQLVKTYGRVHVVNVPGNHGRTTKKPTAKLYSRLSYDTLAAKMLSDRFKGDDRITWQFDESTDQIVEIFGRTIFVSHGDRLGTRGGMGFAGPNLPIIRGAKKVMEQLGYAGITPDLILTGHYHTSSNPGIILANGSVPGLSEYGLGLRASWEPPQQWLFLLHERWWLRERASIRLDEPGKPRVRVPAGMVSS